MEKLKQQSEIVKQNIDYYFKGVDGSWNVPRNLQYLSELLNDIDKLCALALNAKSEASNCNIPDVSNSCVHSFIWDNPDDDNDMHRTCEKCGYKDA